jgi:hypothetical protein
MLLIAHSHLQVKRLQHKQHMWPVRKMVPAGNMYAAPCTQPLAGQRFATQATHAKHLNE